MAYSDAITELLGDGAKAYAHKEYEAAAEKYGEACELYSEENESEDPDLLFLYGNALYQHTVLNSQILGDGSAVGGKEEQEEAKDEEDDGAKGNFQFYDDGPLAEEDEEEDDGNDDDAHVQHEEEEDDDNRETNQEPEQPQEEEEEQSDFEVAWEILDLTRSLFEDRLATLESHAEGLAVPYLKTDKEDAPNEYVKTLKKLSETYDILGEVSLEAENFQQAAADLEKALELRLKLFNPENSALISESHYKLSLALEFCVESPDLRKRATQEMKRAIESVELRIKHEVDPKKITEYKELIQDLSVRYQELKRDPDEELQKQKAEILLGILGEVASAVSSEQNVPAVNDLTAGIKKKKKKAPEAVVNDLSSMVKKRKSPSSSSPAGSSVKKSKS